MIDIETLASLRKGYAEKVLLETNVDKDPVKQLNIWLDEAIKSGISEPNAMVLSTADKNGIPSSRVVLLKGIEDNSLIFFTNYESQKSKELFENPNAAILFFWRDLGRQIRINGRVEKTSKEDYEKYFNTRPFLSRIAAWASRQSQIVPDRDYLVKKFNELEKLYSEGQRIPLPSFWGGFKLIPERFEFWQGRENRMHDRIGYLKEDNKWRIVRLSP